MMLTDAPIADRPIADIGNVVGFADGYADVWGAYRHVIYAATRTFATNHDDSIAPSRPYLGTLDTPLSFKRSLLGGSSIGTFTAAGGTTVLNNQDAGYDHLPATYTADGRPIEIKVMRLGDDLSKAFTVFKGVMTSWFVDESQVAIELRDFGYKLQVPAQPNLYGGTGGLDGNADLAQKRKPMVFGSNLNVTPVLLDPAVNLYQLSDGPVQDIPAVYDRGAVLAFHADYPDLASLLAATIPAGRFATCRALGLFRLNNVVDGAFITADVLGDKTGGVFASSTADILRRWILRVTALTAGDLYEPSFEALNLEQPAPVGYRIGPDDSHTMADVIADLMHGIGGWGGFRRNGLFELRRFQAPSNIPVAYIAKSDIITLKREPPPSDLRPPPFRQRVAYERNWTVQTDVLESASDARKSYLPNPYRVARSATAAEAAIKADYEFAKDPEPIEAFFRDEADAVAEADRQLNLHRTERALYRLTLPRQALYYNLGDTISVTYDRWDLSVGRNMRVVEISESIERQSKGKIDQVEVVAYG